MVLYTLKYYLGALNTLLSLFRQQSDLDICFLPSNACPNIYIMSPFTLFKLPECVSPHSPPPPLERRFPATVSKM